VPWCCCGCSCCGMRSISVTEGDIGRGFRTWQERMGLGINSRSDAKVLGRGASRDAFASDDAVSSTVSLQVPLLCTFCCVPQRQLKPQVLQQLLLRRGSKTSVVSNAVTVECVVARSVVVVLPRLPPTGRTHWVSELRCREIWSSRAVCDGQCPKGNFT